MEIFENFAMMKKLLRQGWIRAGVPLSSIESLADHSWSVAVLTYLFCTIENTIRGLEVPLIDPQKAVLIALFHDLKESEFFDIDKSVEQVVNHEQLVQFQQHLEEGAIRNILLKVPDSIKESFSLILRDHQSEEYHIARVSDLVDLINQARQYKRKHWLDENQFHGFVNHALRHLKQYQKQFHFLEEYLTEFTS